MLLLQSAKMIPGARALQGAILDPVKNTRILLRLVTSNSKSLSPTKENEEEFSLTKPFKEIPGPSFYKILKDPTIFKRQNILWKVMEENFGEIFKIWLPGVGNLIFIKNPKDVQKLLTKGVKFPIEPAFDMFVTYRNVMRKDLFPETAGLFGHHGAKWWEFRNKVHQDMMRPKSAMFYINTLEEISMELIEVLVAKKDANQEIDDALKYTYLWGLESIGAIFLDARLGCLDDNQPEHSDAKLMIKASAVMMGEDALKMALFPFWKYYPFAFYKRFDEASTAMYNISKRYVEIAMQKINDEKDERVDGVKSLLSKLITKCGRDSQIPLVMAMDAMLAGIDTTGNTCAMFLYHLAINPEKQEILDQEIVSLVGDNGSITEAKLNRMKYLKACLHESLRLFSSVGGFGRRPEVDMTLSGYFIPKGTWVFTFFNNNKMDPMQFPEPEKYLPERWLRGCSMHQKAHPFANIPFSHGPRMCIGRRFAELEMLVLTIKLLQRFKLEYHHQPIGWETNFTIKPDKDVKLKLIGRI